MLILPGAGLRICPVSAQRAPIAAQLALNRRKVAEQLTAALPQAILHLHDHPGVLWAERADLRKRMSVPQLMID